MKRWLLAIRASLRRELTLRGALVVLLVCFVISSQILFQSDIGSYALEDTIGAWLEYFGEVLLIGAITYGLVLVADVAGPPEGWIRYAALMGAAFSGVAAGVAIALYLRYGDGIYPNALYVAGEAVRWAILAAVIVLIRESHRRERTARDALHQIELERIAVEKRRTEARLQMMQAQIEPHFLFNTLATVKRLFRTDSKGGTRMLESLVQYLRGALPRVREDESTLGDEVELIAAYLDILRTRMGERLQYSLDVPDEGRALPFPSMMLITLVENAIKHGIGPAPEGGTIAVRAVLVRRQLQVEVADTGVGFRSSSGTGIGLANIRARLGALFGSAAELVLESNEPRGVIARIVAPMPEAA